MVEWINVLIIVGAMRIYGTGKDVPLQKQLNHVALLWPLRLKVRIGDFQSPDDGFKSRRGHHLLR